MRFDRHCLFTARVQDDFDVAMLIAGLSSDHEFAIKDGKLYAIALEDCIVSSKKPLCQMWGEFFCGDEKKSEISKRKSKNYMWQMKDIQFIVSCSVVRSTPTNKEPEPFQNHKPTPVNDFLKFIENSGFHNYSVECHNLKEIHVAGEEMAFGISNSEDCMFLSKPLPAKTAVSKFNLGSKMDFAEWDFPSLKHNLKRVYLVPGLCFEESVNTIVPVKPWIFLTKPVKLMKGQCVLLG